MPCFSSISWHLHRCGTLCHFHFITLALSHIRNKKGVLAITLCIFTWARIPFFLFDVSKIEYECYIIWKFCSPLKRLIKSTKVIMCNGQLQLQLPFQQHQVILTFTATCYTHASACMYSKGDNKQRAPFCAKEHACSWSTYKTNCGFFLAHLRFFLTVLVGFVCVMIEFVLLISMIIFVLLFIFYDWILHVLWLSNLFVPCTFLHQ